MPFYLFGDYVYSSDDEAWQRILRKAYATKLRPTCRCVSAPVAPALYIAMISGRHVLKRLPFTGAFHGPHCVHYEPPPELSGLGQVAGCAIREEVGSDETTLMLDFALTKGRSRAQPAGVDIEHESVRSDGTKLTLRGLFHYLYEQAGLNRWSPNMEGKRSWYIVRRELLTAAVSKKTKGKLLSEHLYIPEQFSAERAAEIKARQIEALAPLAASSNARMILIGEVKSLDDSRYGKTLVVKHMPDLKLMVTADLAKRLVARFDNQLQLWGQMPTTRLLVITTVSRSLSGVYLMESACLVNVDHQWIPFESGSEWALLDGLHSTGRKFVKGLRYNLPSTTPLASVVLQDAGVRSVALFVVPVSGEGEYTAAAERFTQEAGVSTWLWAPDAEAMPALPPLVYPAGAPALLDNAAP